MVVITVYSAKGGVGKTMTTVNLAAALAHSGNGVLVIDGDWQGNTTLNLGLDPRDDAQYALSDLLIAQIQHPDDVEGNLQRAIRYIEKEDLYLIPTNPLMNKQEFQWAIDLPENRYALSELLEHLDFDYVIIDTPAVVNGFLNLAMMASHSVVVPVLPNYASYDSLESTFNAIDAIKEAFNPDLNIVGVLMNSTKNSNRSLSYQEMIMEYAERNGIYVFNTKIPYREVLEDLLGEQVSIFETRSNAKEKYTQLAEEIIQLLDVEKKQNEEMKEGE